MGGCEIIIVFSPTRESVAVVVGDIDREHTYITQTFIKKNFHGLNAIRDHFG
jgi:hypothetical protein